MADLAATDVTVSLTNRHIEDMPGHLRRVFVDLTFGDGALTYPSGGVPLPAKEQYGFKKEIVLGVVEQPYANGFIYKYDRTNHKLLIFTMGIVTVTTGTTPIDITGAQYFFENSAGQGTGYIIPGASVADTTIDMGPLIELPITITPAEVTVRMEFVGE